MSPPDRINSWQDRISWGLLLISLAVYLLPHNTKIKIAPHFATVLLSPLRGITALRTTIATINNDNARLARLAAELALENARLKHYLNLPESTIAIPANSLRLIRSRVIARDITTLKRFFTITCGANDGVQIGSAVIVPEGVVGRVIMVTPHQALVQTIFEPDFRVAVMNARTREIALAHPDQKQKLILDYVNKNADFRIGDTIVTSGLGGIFPKGLRLGVVVETPEQPDALFKPVYVKPFINIMLIEQVFVIITPFPLQDNWLDNLQPSEITIPE